MSLFEGANTEEIIEVFMDSAPDPLRQAFDEYIMGENIVYMEEKLIQNESTRALIEMLRVVLDQTSVMKANNASDREIRRFAQTEMLRMIEQRISLIQLHENTRMTCRANFGIFPHGSQSPFVKVSNGQTQRP